MRAEWHASIFMAEMNGPRGSWTFRPRVLVAVPLAVATALLAVWFQPKLVQLLRAARGMDGVVAASVALNFRPSPARLSGDFPYRNTKPSVRNGEDGNAPTGTTALWALVEELEKKGDRHVLGVVYLLLGKKPLAVTTLEDALRTESGERETIKAIRRSQNAPLLNDLAAAYQAVGDPGDQSRALQAIQRAWSIERTAAIAWTRAAVIESYHLRECSIDAWRDFLTLDPRSEWSDAARRSLNALLQPTETELWPAVRDRLLGVPNDDPVLLRDTDRFRQQVRLLCEDDLLPQWGEAVLQDNDSVASRLEKIAALGNALEKAGGEREVAEAVAAIRGAEGAALRQLAAGHVAYGAARKAESDGRGTDAVREMGHAVSAFDPRRTAFAWRARVELAGEVYLSTDYRGAKTELLRLRDDPAARLSNSCRGELYALLGAVAVRDASYKEAADHYGRALDAFQSAGERDYAATMVGRLADTFDLMGDTAGGRSYRLRALQLLESIGDRKHKHDMMITAAYAAMGEKEDAVADLFFDALVANDIAASNRITACTSLTWRSAFRYHAGRLDAAAADLAAAQRVCASIPDPPQRDRQLANLELARSVFGGDGLSAAQPAGLDDAIRVYQDTHDHVWLGTAYLARARRSWKRGDPAAAERDFLHALEESDLSRDRIDERRLRMQFTATADQIADVYVEFLLEQGRMNDGFDLADRRRVRELVESPTARWSGPGASLRDVQAALPFSAVLVEYRVLTGHIVAWIVSPQSITTATFPLSIGEIEPAIQTLELSPETTEPRVEASLLYDALIRPIEPLLKDAKTLIVVPDDDLERIPYGGLYDNVRQRHLAQSLATVIAPSASLFAQSRQRWSERTTRNERLLVVQAASGDAGMTALPEAVKEAEGLARLYPGTRVIDGPSATPDSLLGQIANASILQFAGHSVVDGDASARALRLGESRQSRLEIADILSARFPALRLVYLSACETDKGPVLKSEGSISIARTFFAAGVPTVVGTLWPIDDEAARLAAFAFHEHLLKGDTPAEALRQAQLDLRARGWPFRDWATLRVIGAGV
jgi:hypothetical protein